MTFILPERDGPAQGRATHPPGHSRIYTERHLDRIPELAGLGAERLLEMRVVSSVLPFRVNEYVLRELIDWDQVPSDPLFQLTFPQRGMLSEEHYDRMRLLLVRGAPKQEILAAANAIRYELNPHPGDQKQHNVPVHGGRPLEGVQHKYRETVLLFPSQGQTCHSYCTFCFRWAQFVGLRELRFAETEEQRVLDYLAAHQEVTDVLFTGGDPMIMRTKLVRRHLEPLLHPRFDHIQTVRIGSKALSFWPQRFVSDPDADELLALLGSLVAAGKHVAFMAHVDHWRELETDVCQRAVSRLQDAGVVIRSQAPLLRHVNDDPDTWATNWRNQVRMGIVPYYMFVERDTGARAYFEVPLARAHEIYTQAIRRVSGLARTARGPSMSAGPGKVEVQGVTQIGGEKVFALRFLQARDPSWVGKPFFARYDAHATWLEQLRPAFGERRFFYEEAYEALCRERVEACSHPGNGSANGNGKHSLPARPARSSSPRSDPVDANPPGAEPGAPPDRAPIRRANARRAARKPSTDV